MYCNPAHRGSFSVSLKTDEIKLKIKNNITKIVT